MRGKNNIQRRDRQRTGKMRKEAHRAYLRKLGVNVENVDQRTFNYQKPQKMANNIVPVDFRQWVNPANVREIAERIAA